MYCELPIEVTSKSLYGCRFASDRCYRLSERRKVLSHEANVWSEPRSSDRQSVLYLLKPYRSRFPEIQAPVLGKCQMSCSVPYLHSFSPRCPLECRPEYSTSSWSWRVFLRFERDALGSPIGKRLLSIKGAVEAVLSRAQRATLRPTLDH